LTRPGAGLIIIGTSIVSVRADLVAPV